MPLLLLTPLLLRPKPLLPPLMLLLLRLLPLTLLPLLLRLTPLLRLMPLLRLTLPLLRLRPRSNNRSSKRPIIASSHQAHDTARAVRTNVCPGFVFSGGSVTSVRDAAPARERGGRKLRDYLDELSPLNTASRQRRFDLKSATASRPAGRFRRLPRQRVVPARPSMWLRLVARVRARPASCRWITAWQNFRARRPRRGVGRLAWAILNRLADAGKSSNICATGGRFSGADGGNYTQAAFRSGDQWRVAGFARHARAQKPA